MTMRPSDFEALGRAELAKLLAVLTNEIGASRFEVALTGLTCGDEQIGDWCIIAVQTRAPTEQEAE